MENAVQLEQEDLFVHRQFTIDRGQEPLRIDKFLMGRIEGISRNKVQLGIEAGNVLVNGLPTRNNYKVKPNDLITVVYSEEPVDYFLIPEKMDLNIAYEDDYIAIVNKPAGMVVHPGVGNFNGTLVNGLLHYFLFQKRGLDWDGVKALSDEEKAILKGVRPFLVHRIDKMTSGLLVVAKEERAMELLNHQFFHHTIDRKYIALVWGNLQDDSGTIRGNIGRSATDRQKFCVYQEEDKGKHAVTHYKVLERFGYVTLIECQLETGRTHQIRVHFSHIGHPLFADDTYGGDRIVKGTIYSKYKQFVENCFSLCNRQALHAKSLGFIHPHTKEKVFFESDLPQDMIQVISKWRTYVSALNE